MTIFRFILDSTKWEAEVTVHHYVDGIMQCDPKITFGKITIDGEEFEPHGADNVWLCCQEWLKQKYLASKKK